MAVIGIDPGTATTGFGFIEELPDGSIRLIDYGVISTDSNDPADRRLHSLYSQLSSMIRVQQPENAAVEKLYFQKNVRTALAVGQARGVILLALFEAGIPFFEYNPMEIKLSVAGYGRADKKQVQQMVQTLLALKELPRPDDAADALAVAICHIHSRRMIELGKEFS